MTVTRRKYNEEFKKDAVKRGYPIPESMRDMAEDLGITESMLYR